MPSLLAKYRECGYRISREGASLKVDADHPLSERMRNVFKERKADLLRELAIEEAAAGLKDWCAALVLGRLHLCVNCTYFCWNSNNPEGVGQCRHFELEAAPFAPFHCSRFAAADAPAIPHLLGGTTHER